MEDTSTAQMTKAIIEWMKRHQDYPEWREWRRAKIKYTLFFDEIASIETEESEDEFKFPEDIEKERLLIIRYLGLKQTIESLRECEYYYRRFPFRGLPVTRSNHITNVCEMYFSRCYEFKQRLKEYLNTLKDITHGSFNNVKIFLKTFDEQFEQELKQFTDLLIGRGLLKRT